MGWAATCLDSCITARTQHVAVAVAVAVADHRIALPL